MASVTNQRNKVTQNYNFGEQIGKGAFGSVVKATVLSPRKALLPGETVAIKMISKALLRQRPQLVSRVQNEILIHNKLSHAHILKLHDFFEDNDHVFIVTEFCSNGELYSFMKKQLKRPFEEVEVKRLFAQVIDGMIYLHGHNIMHRDLKCSNILLDDDLNVKIADFGLAVKIKEKEEQRTVCGTLNYIAPEIASKRPYGLKSDLWALGCLLFTMLTGTTPFKVISSNKENFPSISQKYSFPSHVSTHARDLVEQLLQNVNKNYIQFTKDPSSRIHLEDIPKHPFFVYAAKEQICHLPLFEYFTKPIDYVSCSISTARMKPSVHNLNKNYFRVHPNGMVIAKFSSDPFLLVISVDGLLIYKCKESLQVPDHNEEFLRKQSHLIMDYFTVDKAPDSIRKRYCHVNKYIQLVRSKMTKAIYSVNDIDCRLMENLPSNDFEMTIKNEAKLRFCSFKNQIHLQCSKGDFQGTLTDDLKNLKIPSFVMPYFEQANSIFVEMQEYLNSKHHSKFPVCLHKNGTSSMTNVSNLRPPATVTLPSSSFFAKTSVPSNDFLLGISNIKFIPDIGWGLKTTEANMHIILFNKGHAVAVSMQNIYFRTIDSGWVSYSLKQPVPLMVKESLRFIGVYIREIQMNERNNTKAIE